MDKSLVVTEEISFMLQKDISDQQEILIIPESHTDDGAVFSQESIPFYKFVRNIAPDTKIDFDAKREEIQERALHSFDIYMPIVFIATNILLPIVVGLVTNYIDTKMKGREHEECTVKMKFIVKTADSYKKLEYDGPAKDFEKTFEKIDITKL